MVYVMFGLLDGVVFRYAGRHSSPSTATGTKATHIFEHGEVMKKALHLKDDVF